jgi:hypothetical protein
MAPRALMAPPGSPEFFTRTRTVGAGPVVLQGRAWSGRAPVERVEVSADGGGTWADAELEPELGRWAWRGWTFPWDARPGEHVLCCRATDVDGNSQPDEPPWNVGGYANNAIQRVVVNVVP